MNIHFYRLIDDFKIQDIVSFEETLKQHNHEIFNYDDGYFSHTIMNMLSIDSLPYFKLMVKYGLDIDHDINLDSYNYGRKTIREHALHLSCMNDNVETFKYLSNSSRYNDEALLVLFITIVKICYLI